MILGGGSSESFRLGSNLGKSRPRPEDVIRVPLCVGARECRGSERRARVAKGAACTSEAETGCCFPDRGWFRSRRRRCRPGWCCLLRGCVRGYGGCNENLV